MCLDSACCNTEGRLRNAQPYSHRSLKQEKIWRHLARLAQGEDTEQFRELLAQLDDVNTQSTSGESLLILAAQSSQIEIIRVLWSRHELRINQVDQQGNTALHYAVENRATPVARLLLKFGAMSSINNRSGYNALHLAVLSNQVDMLAAIVMGNRQSLDVASDDNLTPLALAALKNHPDCCHVLAKRGASPNLRLDPPGLTPLHMAAGNGNVECITSMLSAMKPDTNGSLRLDTTDANMRTPLHLAVIAGHTAVVSQLLLRGASCTAKDEDGSSVLHVAVEHAPAMLPLLVKHTEQVDVTDASMQTPLHLAAKLGLDNALEALLAAKPNVLSKDRYGQLPAFLACKQGHTSTLKRLMEADERQAQQTDHRGWTMMHWAAALGHLDHCDVLLRSGVPIDVQESNGLTPCFLAVNQQDLAVVQWFLAQGLSQPDLTDQEGQTLLHLAAQNGWEGICKELIRQGCTKDKLTRKGLTPLHCAAKKGSASVVQLLLDSGCDPDTGDIHAIPPLHYAAMADSPSARQTCWALALKTRNYNLILDQGPAALHGTALDVAYRHKRSANAQALIESGISSEHIIKHSAAARVQATWRLRCTLVRQAKSDPKRANNYRKYMRAMMLSHLAVVRLHFRHVAWRRHASFLQQLGQTADETTHLADAILNSTRRAGTARSTNSKLRKHKSDLNKPQPSAPANLPPIVSTERTHTQQVDTGVSRQIQAQSKERRQQINTAVLEQQQKITLLRKQNELLESINHHQAKAMARSPKLGASKTAAYGRAANLQSQKFEQHKELISKYQARVDRVKGKLTNALDIEQAVLDAEQAGLKTNGQHQLLRAQQQVARRGLKDALKEVSELRAKAESLSNKLLSQSSVES
eukprot:TRINITY_DN9059_c0_g1_i5.p1 TRINITY_DN9059_c0_g1~~TRINITY_DN9059_c0_g1_i5.p1  ORF type:complete len:868 (+),score=115.46 TRINITY_DN9059_c0_g1_i5:58-2661(+)